jgi:uncharacterized SAM-binding protein YcdF (DUF218 family)
VFFFLRPFRTARRIVGALVGVLLLYLGVTFVQVWWASGQDDARPSDAIVVLGAAQYDGRPSPVFQQRLDHALELYRAGVAPFIVTTGANQEGDRFTQGYAGYDYLRAAGVPEEAIVVITDGATSFEELQATANQADRFGIQTVVLVSDPYHAKRIELIAEEVGLSAVVSPTDGGRPLDRLLRETGAVAAGRIISFRRLDELV